MKSCVMQSARIADSTMRTGFHGSRRWIGVRGLGALLIVSPWLPACSKSLEDRVAEFEEDSDVAFQDCGYQSGGCSLNLLDPPVACLKGAWESCAPAKLRQSRFWLARQPYEAWYFIVPLEGGGCEVVAFEHTESHFCDVQCSSGEWDTVRHCGGLEFVDLYCVEPTACARPQEP